MVLVISERSLEDDTKKSHMGETAVATKGGELSLSPRNLDLTEFAYPSNREVVSFDNASINVDSSSEVFFGPVTQLNVNGNVTIVQNGNGDDADEDNNSEKKQADSAYSSAVNFTKSSQALKYWIVLIYKRLFCPRDKIFVIITSGMLIIVVGLVLYPVLANLLSEKVKVQEEKLYGRLLGNHTVFYKTDWDGLRCSRFVKMPHPVGLVIVSHTNSQPCNSFTSCANALRLLQKSQMNKGMSDIAFNFAIGGDGNVYVGRGWDNINSHAHLSIGISFIGNYNIDSIDKNMSEAAQILLHQGVLLGKLSEDYVLIGHNQSCKNFLSSPGNNVYKEITKWDHYSNITLYTPVISSLVKFVRRLPCDELGWTIS